MLKIKTLDKQKMFAVIWKITCIFVMLQPLFDLLSFLFIRGYINIGISTFAKPLIVGIINIVLLLVYKKQIWRCAITYVSYLALMIVHTLLLDGMLIENAVILHEIRFMINILYFLICYHDFRILSQEAPEKEIFASQLKKVLIFTFGFYIVLYLLAVVTGTSSMTYEYSDAYKVGFKGWMDSGQIFGHALCVCLPFITNSLLNSKITKTWLRILCKVSVALPVLVLCLIGTKVSYYIAILVFSIQILLELFFAFRKKGNSHYFNAGICLACVVACILAYPITPVKYNTDINNSVLSVQLNEEEIHKLIENDKKKHESNIKDKNVINKKPQNETENETDGSTDIKISEAAKNLEWTSQALEVVEQMYADGKLHPSDMRNRQLVFSLEKFKLSDLKYKLFGIGYLIHNDLAIERDVLCVLFCFGIIGFIIVLIRPLLLWIKSAFVLLRRLLKADLEAICLFEGFSMFFFISWYAGATFIYTNFSIFLAIIMCLLSYNINKIKNSEIKK